MNGLGKSFRKKIRSEKLKKKTVKIEGKLPHEQKTTSEKANLCSNTVFSLYFKIRAEKFHEQKPTNVGRISLERLSRRRNLGEGEQATETSMGPKTSKWCGSNPQPSRLKSVTLTTKQHVSCSVLHHNGFYFRNRLNFCMR